MNRKLFVTITSATAFWAAGALADCNDEIADLNDDISDQETLGLGVSVVGEQDMRTWRDAAQLFAEHGHDEACEDLIENVRTLLDDKQDMVEEQWEEAQANQQHEQYMALLKQAEPISSIERPLQVQALVGRDLRNHNDEVLGEIEAVVVGIGGKQVTHILVSRGGLLGIGEDQIAVPWEHVSMTEDGAIVVLRMSEDRFDDAPAIDRDDNETLGNASWTQANASYFDDHTL